MEDSRELHAKAAAAYMAWAEWTAADQVWDELATYEQSAWRKVVKTVRENDAKEPLTFKQLLDMAEANGAGPGHDTDPYEGREDT